MREGGVDCDFLVIGGGSAGYAGARTAARQGLRTVVVEGAEEMGGLCILRGCMPSKTLIDCANRVLAIRRAGAFGIRVPAPEVDLRRVIARKRELIGEFAAYRREQLEAGEFELVRGLARFVDARTVEVALRGGGSCRISARSFLIATGSERARVPVPGLESCGALTSDDVLDAEELPGSVVVLGGGPVALEMAHYLSAMGAQVTIIQRSAHVLRGVDADLAVEVEEAFRERGVAVHTGTRLREVRREGAGVVVRFSQDGREQEVRAGAVFDGLGRQPALGGLGLERAGVEVKRPLTDLTQRTNVGHIFAAGDCTGQHEIVHVAIQQGEVAARNAARQLRGEHDLESMDYRLKMFVVFTDPQVAVVGAGEEELRASGRPFLAARHPFNDHGKSLVMGETRGFVKLLADPDTREILGGAAAGPHASDLIHEIAVAMGFRATAGRLAALPHYHPTLSEIWTYPAEELAG